MSPSTAGSSAGAVAAVVLAAVLFGTTGTAQELGPSGTTPLGVGAARLAVGGLVLLLVLPLLGASRSRAVALWRTPAGLTAGATRASHTASSSGVVPAGTSRAAKLEPPARSTT